MAQESVFDEVNGIFRVNGRLVPRVSEILVGGGIVDPTFFTEESRIRGTAVHQAVFLDIFGDLHFASLHDVVKPYIGAWLKFKREVMFRPILPLCEKRQYHPIYDYVGRPDILCWVNGRPAIIDIKSGGAGAAKYQLAAYREFPAVVSYVPDRFSLQLMRDGRYSLNRYDDPRDWIEFVRAIGRFRESRAA